MSSHIKTAYEYGVAEALKRAGYSSAEEFSKEAFSVGDAADIGKLLMPGAALGSLIGAVRGGEDHRLEGALKGGLGGAVGAGLGGLAGAHTPDLLHRLYLARAPRPMESLAAGALGYLPGAALGGYLGGGMAQEEPSTMDKLRRRLGMDS
jgi:hypothetical protein